MPDFAPSSGAVPTKATGQRTFVKGIFCNVVAGRVEAPVVWGHWRRGQARRSAHRDATRALDAVAPWGQIKTFLAFAGGRRVVAVVVTVGVFIKSAARRRDGQIKR